MVLLSAVLVDSQVMLLFMSWLALSWSILSRREQIQTNRVAAHSDSFERMRFRRLGTMGRSTPAGGGWVLLPAP